MWLVVMSEDSSVGMGGVRAARVRALLPAMRLAAMLRLAILSQNRAGRASRVAKLWGGRFTEPTDTTVEAFTASVDFDRRLYRQDIAGSVAHATMLAEVGVLDRRRARRDRGRPSRDRVGHRRRPLRVVLVARGRPHEHRGRAHRADRRGGQEAPHRAGRATTRWPPISASTPGARRTWFSAPCADSGARSSTSPSARRTR